MPYSNREGEFFASDASQLYSLTDVNGDVREHRGDRLDLNGHCAR